MMTIHIKINGLEKDVIRIVNQNVKKDGYTRYLVNNKYDVWHKRSDGRLKLAMIALCNIVGAK